jgi:hypothetical protein
MRLALMSTNEVLAQLMENISHPPTEFDTQKSQSNRGGTKSNERYYGINHTISCQCCH